MIPCLRLRLRLRIVPLMALSWVLAAADDLTREQAEWLVAEGVAALKASDADPRRAVDAAVALVGALDHFSAAEDWPRVHALKASLFWCRKRMDLEDIDRYLERIGQAPTKTHRDALQQLVWVVDEPVAASEARAYFARAEAFARANPERPFEIAIRWYEVAERFAGSQESLVAQQRSLAAQRAHMRAVNLQEQAMASGGDQRSTIFTRRARPGTGSMPVPDDRAQREARRVVEEAYRARLRARSDRDRWRLADDLLAAGIEEDADPRLRWALFELALESASRGGAAHLVLAIVDRMAMDFAAIDAAGRKQEVLGSMRRFPAAKAIAALLVDPFDPEANTVAGLFYAFEVGDHRVGWALLAEGGDRDYCHLAEMELAAPTQADECLQLAQAWDERIRVTRDRGLRAAVMARAVHWYGQALPGLDGLTASQATARHEELALQVPLTQPADWTTLTELDWRRIPGKAMTVDAKKSNDPGFRLDQGESLRVVPHPEDTWKTGGKTYDWRGSGSGSGDVATGGLWVKRDDGPLEAPGIITGPVTRIRLGQLWSGSFGEGTIRVKLVPVEDHGGAPTPQHAGP